MLRFFSWGLLHATPKCVARYICRQMDASWNAFLNTCDRKGCFLPEKRLIWAEVQRNTAQTGQILICRNSTRVCQMAMWLPCRDKAVQDRGVSIAVRLSIFVAKLSNVTSMQKQNSLRLKRIWHHVCFVVAKPPDVTCIPRPNSPRQRRLQRNTFANLRSNLWLILWLGPQTGRPLIKAGLRQHATGFVA